MATKPRKKQAKAPQHKPAAPANKPGWSPSAKPEQIAGRSGLSSRARLLISIGLLLHLLAVAAPPMSVPPASGLQQLLTRLVRPYAESMFLNHGYRFFAPDPGASDMMRAEITTKDGQRLPDLVYPDLREQWPRLLYHRHFMLTSRLQQAPLDPLGAALAQSYARHLHAKYDAQEVRLYRLLHRLPMPEEVRQGLRLSDESLYETPYGSPLGHWQARGGTASAETQLHLTITEEAGQGTALLQGKLLGQDASSRFGWRFAAPRQLAFTPDGLHTMTVDWPSPHELLFRYARTDGSEEAILFRRDPPPLVGYRGEGP